MQKEERQATERKEGAGPRKSQAFRGLRDRGRKGVMCEGRNQVTTGRSLGGEVLPGGREGKPSHWKKEVALSAKGNTGPKLEGGIWEG